MTNHLYITNVFIINEKMNPHEQFHYSVQILEFRIKTGCTLCPFINLINGLLILEFGIKTKSLLFMPIY